MSIDSNAILHSSCDKRVIIERHTHTHTIHVDKNCKWINWRIVWVLHVVQRIEIWYTIFVVVTVLRQSKVERKKSKNFIKMRGCFFFFFFVTINENWHGPNGFSLCWHFSFLLCLIHINNNFSSFHLKSSVSRYVRSVFSMRLLLLLLSSFDWLCLFFFSLLFTFNWLPCFY